MSDTEKPHRKLHEIKRHVNEEDTHPLLANLFFCYFFPYICRCTPVTDPDIPDARKSDDTKEATRKLKARWQPEYEEFAQRRRKYEEQVKDNPRYIIPSVHRNTLPFVNSYRRKYEKPEPPSLAKAMLYAGTSFQTICAVICLILGFLFISL